MQELRIVLIVVGIILIVALLAHGFWSSRKNRPVKLKDAKAKSKSKQKDTGPRDDQGFDEFGLGEARVIGDPLFQDLSDAGVDQEQMHADVSDPTGAPDVPTSTRPLVADPQALFTPKESVPEHAQQNVAQQPPAQAPSAQVKDSSPVQSAAPSSQPTVASPAPERKEPAFSFSALDDEPIDLGTQAGEQESPANPEPSSAFEMQLDNDSPAISSNFASDADSEANSRQEPSIDAPEEPQALAQPDDVFVLNVVAQRGKAFSGLDVVNCLDSHGLFFGEMDIFHRHEDNSGLGEVVYSVANMLNPGVFNMDTIKEFETRGMTFFMAVPGPGQPYKNFSLMHTTALAIARELNGLLVDDQRNPLTQQTLNHYQQRVREYERKQLLAAQ